MRRSTGSTIFDVVNALLLVAFGLTILYPFWTTLLLSFSDVHNATTLGFRFWVPEWQSAAYKFAFSSYGRIEIAYVNSIIRTVAGTLLTLLFTTLAAYPLSDRRLPGRTIMTVYILITMFFSGGLIPNYLLIRRLGLINTRAVLILPTAVMAYYIIIARNFFMTIDKAYEEAAIIDGANYVQVLVRIIVPLSKPLLATIALWAAVRHWNSWFDALIYTTDESQVVLQLLLQRLLRSIEHWLAEGMQDFMVQEEVTMPSSAVRAAVTMMTIGPIILMYPFLQKYFVKGIRIGSLKG